MLFPSSNNYGIQQEEYIKIEREIWNTAIEEATKAIDDEGDYNPASYYIEAIRKLKK